MVIIAVSGCVHGHLDFLYETLLNLEASRGIKADILLCTGDFQALRGNYDLPTLSCPAKYRQLGDFKAYYLGRCGVVRFGSLRIAGISGIYHEHSYNTPLPRNPRSEEDYHSLYRVRLADVEKICNISQPDIFLSHD